MIRSDLHMVFVLIFSMLGINIQYGQNHSSANDGTENIDLLSLINIYDNIATHKAKQDYFNNIPTYLRGKSTDSLLDVLATIRKNLNESLIPIAHLVEAEIYNGKQDREMAEKIYRDNIDALTTANSEDYALLSNLYLNLVHLFYYKHNSQIERLTISEKGLVYARKSEEPLWINQFLSHLSRNYQSIGETDKGMRYVRESRELAAILKDSTTLLTRSAQIMENLAINGEERKALELWHQLDNHVHTFKFKKSYADRDGKSAYYSRILVDAAETYYRNNILDTALTYIQMAEEKAPNPKLEPISLIKGKIFMADKKWDRAKKSFKKELAVVNINALDRILEASNLLAQCYLKTGDVDSAKQAIYSAANSESRIQTIIRQVSLHDMRADMYVTMADVFEKSQQLDSALYFTKLANRSIQKGDSLNSEIQLALAKVELEVNDLLNENEALITSKDMLSERVSKTKRTYKFIILSFFLATLLIGLLLYNRNQKENLRASLLKEQVANKERIAIEAELNAIRSQMNPHFMFNSLNSINEFIQNDNSENASNYLVKFSRLMRATLNYSKKKFVPLQEEIDLLKLYVELENLRFSNSIDFYLEIDDSIDTNKVEIPPMMIQPFLENAMWHGLMPKESNRKLKVDFTRINGNLKCVVEDNGIGRKASKQLRTQRPGHKSQGIGLTQRRVELLENLYGSDANIEVEDLYQNGTAKGTRINMVLPINKAGDD